MLDEFQTFKNIILVPTDSAKPHTFIFEAAESIDKPGSLPYGESIADAEVSATLEGVDVTSELIAGTSVSDNNVIVEFNYPSASGPGTYHILITLTLAVSGATVGYRFLRIVAKEFE